jgi:hypothetical protein
MMNILIKKIIIKKKKKKIRKKKQIKTTNKKNKEKLKNNTIKNMKKNKNGWNVVMWEKLFSFKDLKISLYICNVQVKVLFSRTNKKN